MTNGQLIIVVFKALKYVLKEHIILNSDKIIECSFSCNCLDHIAFRIQEITCATGDWEVSFRLQKVHAWGGDYRNFKEPREMKKIGSI